MSLFAPVCHVATVSARVHGKHPLGCFPAFPRSGRLSLLLACAVALPLLPTRVSAAEALAPQPAETAPQPTAPTPAPAPTPPATTAAPQPRVLTLQDSVAIALERNRAIQIAQDQLDIAQARVAEAVAPSRIQARAQASITRNDEASTITLPGGDGGAQTVDISPLYSRNAQLVVSKQIDISGALRAARNIAELGALSAQIELERTREQTVLDVRNAFYQVLRAQAALDVAEANLASLEEHLRQAQAFYREGVKAQFDVLRAETQVANARQGVIAARNAVDLAKAALNTTMGIEVTTPILVRAEEEFTPVVPQYAESVAVAYENRAEVQQAQVAIEAARRGVSLARAGGRPSLALSLNTNATADGGAFQTRAVQWNAVAALSLPILEGGLTRARVRQAQGQVESAVVTEDQVRQAVALDVQQAILSMSDAVERMQAAAKNVDQAREALRLAKLRYQEGISTTLEVTDAQAALTQAESNLVNARYDYLQARARYLRAIGAPATQGEALPAPGTDQQGSTPGEPGAAAQP
ncbi:MAG TPA: TolC family protein [Armatimonadetes bacterium]|jgi:outer membrane protein|nr:TolC family protein [Armatimonadota bacterium]